MGQLILALPPAERDINLEAFPTPMCSSYASSELPSASQPRRVKTLSTRPKYSTPWPQPDSAIWTPISHPKNPGANLALLPTEIILMIMKYGQNDVTNTCLGLTCSRLYTMHFAENGPTDMRLISPVWTETITQTWNSETLFFKPTRIQCVALYQMIEDFMAPGWIYDRRGGTYRRAEVMAIENERRRLEIERHDRDREKRLVILRASQEKAARMNVLKRKRDIIEKKQLRARAQQPPPKIAESDPAINKKAAKAKRKKAAKRARRRVGGGGGGGGGQYVSSDFLSDSH
ncbi:hypothetical protein ACEPPN_011147 [Leptodophora sp. 'Broadleaf-Isolate-01']